MNDEVAATLEVPPPAQETSPVEVDGIAVARLYGEPLFALPTDRTFTNSLEKRRFGSRSSSILAM